MYKDLLIYKDFLIKQLTNVDCDVNLHLRCISYTVGKIRQIILPPLDVFTDTDCYTNKQGVVFNVFNYHIYIESNLLVVKPDSIKYFIGNKYYQIDFDKSYINPDLIKITSDFLFKFIGETIYRTASIVMSY